MTRWTTCPKCRVPLQDQHKTVPWCDRCAWTPPGADLDSVDPPDDNHRSWEEIPTSQPRREAREIGGRLVYVCLAGFGARSHLTLLSGSTLCGRDVAVLDRHWHGQEVDELGAHICLSCMATVEMGKDSKAQEVRPSAKFVSEKG